MKKANSKFPIQLHSFVLMSNHYHMILQTPDKNIDKFMWVFNKSFADKLRINAQRINRVFGGPYNWSIISNSNYLFNVIRYVFQNPIRAGLVNDLKEYPFSSLFYEINNKKFPIPLHQIMEDKNINFLEWFNYNPKTRENQNIRKALRRTYFTPSQDSNTGKEFKLTNLTQISYRKEHGTY